MFITRGVECTLAVFGTGGPVKRKHIVIPGAGTNRDREERIYPERELIPGRTSDSGHLIFIHSRLTFFIGPSATVPAAREKRDSGWLRRRALLKGVFECSRF